MDDAISSHIVKVKHIPGLHVFIHVYLVNKTLSPYHHPAWCVFLERVTTCARVDKSACFKRRNVSAVSLWAPCAGAAGAPDGVLAAHSAVL